MSHEDHVRGARIANARMTPEQKRANGHKGGLRTKESGWHETPAGQEAASRRGHLAGHQRWHVNRGIVNPKCPYCQGSVESP
jgi:hypothetical protein